MANTVFLNFSMKWSVNILLYLFASHLFLFKMLTNNLDVKLINFILYLYRNDLWLFQYNPSYFSTACRTEITIENFMEGVKFFLFFLSLVNFQKFLQVNYAHI